MRLASSQALLALLIATCAVLPASRALAQDPGYTRSYVIRADAAWITPTDRISPAFVGVNQGRIEWIAKTNRAEGGRGGLIPTQPPKVIEVKGTLAAGVVDAWCRIGPGDLLAEGRDQPLRRVTDALPLQRQGEDLLFVAQVLAARDSGIAALYLSSGFGRLRSGVGTAAGFSGFDLPVAKGVQALDCAVGSALGAQSTYAAQDLVDAFGEAKDWRESLEEHREKMEQYAKDMEEYRKKFDEYATKKAESEGKETKETKEKEPAKNGEKTAEEKKAGEKKEEEKEEKKDEAPKRPERPKEPKPNAARDLILDAFDGELAVRVAADDAEDIRLLLAAKEEHGFDLVILGGYWADQVAGALADADVPVILAALPDHHARRYPDRSLAARYRALRAAGVTVALASGGGEGEQALLLARAGELVATGEDPAEIWAALTSVPAQILGLAGEYGTLAADCSASMVLFEGTSPFDASTPFKAHKPR
jgi:imidazolonepropionase-like amidohydrolase